MSSKNIWDWKSKPVIGVIGSGYPSSAVMEIARSVGREIARAGAVLICGGLGGVMEAACRGAKEEGGFTVGVLPGESASEANSYVDFVLLTGMGEARNLIIVHTAHALVACGGAEGTLSEIAFALKRGKLLVGIDTWKVVDPGGKDDYFPCFLQASDAVGYVLDRLGGMIC